MTLGLVIFDCDGVLIDSEPVSRRVLAEEAQTLGWALTEAAAQRFTGLTWSALQPICEAAIGHPLPPDWPVMLQNRLIETMQAGVPAMAGARSVLEATASLGLAYRIASNSSHQEMAHKFASNGLDDLVAGRVHSARDVVRGKPAPDLFLAAAAAEGVAPDACVVVEDSVPGMQAAHAAGMRVIAFAPDRSLPGVSVPIHHTVRRLDQLPALFKGLMVEQAA